MKDIQGIQAYGTAIGLIGVAIILLVIGLNINPSADVSGAFILEESVSLNPVHERDGFLTLSWNAPIVEEPYVFQLSKSPDFSSVIVSEETTSSEIRVPAQFALPDTVYYARVGSNGSWSEVHEFIVRLDACLGVVCNSPPNKQCFQSVGFCEEGACRYIPKPVGSVCDDGLACTALEYCSSEGSCIGQDFCPDTCNGNIQLTAGSCGQRGACQYLQTQCEFGCSHGLCLKTPPVSFSQSTSSKPPAQTTITPLPSSPFEIWHGEFFDNIQLSGQSKFSRLSTDINFDWSTTGPDPELNDSFSVRWRKNALFEQGLYNFTVRADDGVRVYIDGQRISELDQWKNQPVSTYSALRTMQAGVHEITIEYYENTVNAVLAFSYKKATISLPALPPPTTPPPPPATPPPTTSPSPPPPSSSPGKSVNLLTNPGFDTGLQGWGWHKNRDYVWWDSSLGRSKAGAICVRNGVADVTEVFSGSFRVRRGQHYQVSGYARLMSGSIDRKFTQQWGANYGGARVGVDQKPLSTTTYKPIDENASYPPVDASGWTYTSFRNVIDDKGFIWDGNVNNFVYPYVPEEVTLTVWLDIFPFTGNAVVCFDDISLIVEG